MTASRGPLSVMYYDSQACGARRRHAVATIGLLADFADVDAGQNPPTDAARRRAA